jgi:hypothetical protein
MSTSLKVELVFGVKVKFEDLRLDYENLVAEFDGNICEIEPVDPVTWETREMLVYPNDSLIKVVQDRGGYKFDQPVVSINDLPDSSEFAATVKRFLPTVLKDGVSLNITPGWLINVMVG